MKKVFSGILVVVLLSVVFAFAAAPAAESLNKEQTKWMQQLDSKKADKRMEAIQHLVDLECVQAKDKLVSLMQDDETYQNRITAAKALMELGFNDTAKMVEKQAEREENNVAKNTLNAIAKKMQKNS